MTSIHPSLALTLKLSIPVILREYPGHLQLLEEGSVTVKRRTLRVVHNPRSQWVVDNDRKQQRRE